jgi:HEAT repeat protein
MPLVRKPAGTGTPDEARAEPAAARVLDTLVTGNDDERWSAARAAASLPESVSALGEALKREENARVREAIFTSLARIATPLSIETVLPFVRSDDAQLRTEALDALAAMKDAIWPYVAALVHDPSPAVRVLACDLVRGMPNDQAVPLFCDILESDPEPNVCASAIDALAEIGEPEALPALARCAERFQTAPFLVFSIKIATDRIRSQARKPNA